MDQSIFGFVSNRNFLFNDVLFFAIIERYKTSHANQIKSNDISLNYPSVLSAETVEVFAKEFRNDNIQCTEKAANNDTFNVNRFGNKNAYMFFSLRIFFDDFTLDLKSLDTCTPNTV